MNPRRVSSFRVPNQLPLNLADKFRRRLKKINLKILISSFYTHRIQCEKISVQQPADTKPIQLNCITYQSINYCIAYLKFDLMVNGQTENTNGMSRKYSLIQIVYKYKIFILDINMLSL